MRLQYIRAGLIRGMCAAASLLCLWTVMAGNEHPGQETQAKEAFSDIRRAWLKSDVNSLIRYIGDAKVIISFESEGIESGLYSRNQAYYLLEAFFKKTKSVTLTYVKIIDEDVMADKPHAFGEYTYTRMEDETLKHAQMYISLSKMNHRWFITHLMSLEKPRGQQPKSDFQHGRSSL